MKLLSLFCLVALAACGKESVSETESVNFKTSNLIFADTFYQIYTKVDVTRNMICLSGKQGKPHTKTVRDIKYYYFGDDAKVVWTSKPLNAAKFYTAVEEHIKTEREERSKVSFYSSIGSRIVSEYLHKRSGDKLAQALRNNEDIFVLDMSSINFIREIATENPEISSPETKCPEKNKLSFD